jgi:hypothetical protein
MIPRKLESVSVLRDRKGFECAKLLETIQPLSQRHPSQGRVAPVEAESVEFKAAGKQP